jgi:hypothetical protein
MPHETEHIRTSRPPRVCLLNLRSVLVRQTWSLLSRCLLARVSMLLPRGVAARLAALRPSRGLLLAATAPKAVAAAPAVCVSALVPARTAATLARAPVLSAPRAAAVTPPPALAGAPARLLHGSPPGHQDWNDFGRRRGLHRGGGGGGFGGGGPVKPPLFTFPLLILLGAVGLMTVGGVLFVFVVPVVILLALGSFVLFALRRSGGGGRRGGGVGGLGSLASRMGGAGSGVGDAAGGGPPLPMLGRWLVSLLGRAAGSIASEVEAQARLGRHLHHNLQARVRRSGTIRTECGRGVLLGPPAVFSSSSSSVGVAGGGLGVPGGGMSRKVTTVHLEAPLQHDRLGVRGVLVVDATVTPRDGSTGGGGGAAAAASADGGGGDIVDAVKRWAARFQEYANGVVVSASDGSSGGSSSEEDAREAAWQAQRAARLEERYARRERRRKQREAEGRPDTAPPGGGLDMGTLAEYLSELAEDVADEARIRGSGQPPLAFTVEAAVLRLPGGRVVDLSHELGGLYVEDLVEADPAAAATTTASNTATASSESGGRDDGAGGSPGRRKPGGGGGGGATAVRRGEAGGRVIDADWYEKR